MGSITLNTASNTSLTVKATATPQSATDLAIVSTNPDNNLPTVQYVSRDDAGDLLNVGKQAKSNLKLGSTTVGGQKAYQLQLGDCGQLTGRPDAVRAK